MTTLPKYSELPIIEQMMQKYECEAKLAFGLHFERMLEFLKSKNIDTPSMINYMSDCLYHLTLSAEERFNMEFEIRGSIRNAKREQIEMIKEEEVDPEYHTQSLEDEFYIDPNSQIEILEDDIIWLSKITRAGENQALKYHLTDVLDYLQYGKHWRTTDIWNFLFELFGVFEFDNYSDENYKIEHMDFIKKMVRDIKRNYQQEMIGLDPSIFKINRENKSYIEKPKLHKNQQLRRRADYQLRINDDN